MDAAERIKIVAVALGLVIVLRGGLQYAVSVLGTFAPLFVQRRLVTRGYSAMLRTQISYVHNRNVGILTNNVNGHPFRVAASLTLFCSIVTNGVMLLVLLALMMMLSWKMSLLAFILVICAGQTVKSILSKPLRTLGKRLTETNSRLYQITYETMNAMKLIRLSVAERTMELMHGKAFLESQRATLHQNLLQSIPGPAMNTAAGLLICVFLFVGAVLYGGQISGAVGPAILFLFLLYRLVGPVSSANAALARIQANLHAFEELKLFYRETEAERQPNGNIEVKGLEDGVTFEDVTFAYDQTGDAAVSGINFTIRKGETVAIVGPSGAGKSTIVGLLARLYDPRAGRILVDGRDLRDLDVATWRRLLSVVSQDIVVFDDTVTGNICFGRGDLPPEKVREATRFAAADEFIEKLPLGYDTMLGPSGVRLSGGQQQRIAIARAALADPELLIFDEATSQLDGFTERAIQNALKTLGEDRTVLVIAHRLSTVRRADTILVMGRGHLVEHGTHDSLLRAKGIYWDMIEHQKLDFIDKNNIAH